MAVAIAVVLLVSAFAFLPKQTNGKSDVAAQGGGNSTATSSPTATASSKSSPTPVSTESAHAFNTDWTKVATNAWSYFQPGVGVDPSTGLPYACGTYFEFFTDWDLGVYIQAVIDAQEAGFNRY